MRNFLLFFVLLIVLFSCVPENKKILTEVNIDLRNPEIRRLLEYQNRQEIDSITGFMDHEDPSLRYLATKSFASYQDPLALRQLYPKLHDPILKVRTAAAYAIGQIGKKRSQDSLIGAFKQKDTISVDNDFNSTILESVGKVGDVSYLKSISTVNTYRPSDSLLLVGQARAIYRYMLRGTSIAEGTSKMIEILTNESYPNQSRLIAAHYLARAKDINLDAFKFQINKVFNEVEDVDIKMTLATVLGKIEDKEIEDNLINQLNLNLDYRSLCNVIRSLNKTSYIRVAEKLLDKLKDPNRHIALVAADYFVRNGNKDDATFYRDYAKDSLHYQVKSKMYEATLVNLPHYYTNTRNATKNQIRNLIKSTEDPIEIKSYIEALAFDPPSYKWMYEELYNSDIQGIQTAVIQGLGNMLTNESFDLYFKGYAKRVRTEILGYLKEAMSVNDEGLIGASADIISNEKAGLKALIDSTEFISESLKYLKMPGQVESINAVEKALGYLSNQPNIDLSKPKGSKEYDWEIINEMGDSLQALVKTNKGVFQIKLYTKAAPATVINFVNLANQDFYDNKIFHRVVPNFVIQTGSPRSDNYGGKEYVIRSEFSQNYYDAEGYVGMASAGAHTESTQWFVTHSPTPHLDGRYTIFGKVTEGMDVVHNIFEGDKILEVVISNL